MGRCLIRTAAVCALVWVCALIPRAATAQPPALGCVVVDQTGLPLPGATVQLRNGDVVIATVSTGPDGTFVFTPPTAGPTLAVSLDGFETSVVPANEAARIVLVLAHTTETTNVVGTSEPAAAAPTRAGIVREIGGWRSLVANRHRTTVLAVNKQIAPPITPKVKPCKLLPLG